MRSVSSRALITGLVIFEITLVGCRNGDRVLSRRKRYLSFPEGSSLSIAICITVQTIITNTLYTQGINWGISYNLPNDTSTLKEIVKPKRTMQRRHRRDLYHKLEIVMNSMGFDGRSCIFRTLCETTRTLMSKNNSILEEMLKIIFKFPLKRLYNWEPEEHRLYHWASRMGTDSEKECSDMFSNCPFSLIDVALDGYTEYLQNTFA